MGGERLARGFLACEGSDVRCFGACLLGGKLVLGGRGFQLFQLQFHLVQKAGGALGARPKALAVEFRDHQLQMGNQRLIVRKPGLGCCEFGLCCDQRRLERFNVIGNIGRQIHDESES